MTLLVFILLFSLLVLVHELGHFFWAKRFGIKVEEFGLGLPPKIKTLFHHQGTDYTLNWLPLGGFVRLLGENSQEVKPQDQAYAFANKPRWQRSLVLLGGIINNFILGIFLFSLIYSILGVPHIRGQHLLILKVAPDSPAAIAGLKSGEIIQKLNGHQVSSADIFTREVKAQANHLITLQVAQVDPNGKISDRSELKSLIPRSHPPVNQGSLGVVIAEMPDLVYQPKPWYQAPFYGLVFGTQEAYQWSKEILVSFTNLIKQGLQGHLPQDLTGPVGIYKMTGEAQKAGWLTLARLAAILSINLAIFNLLPFPALDGGRLLFVWLEKLVNRHKLDKIEAWIHTLGFTLLILLLLLVTWQDLRRH